MLSPFVFSRVLKKCFLVIFYCQQNARKGNIFNCFTSTKMFFRTISELFQLIDGWSTPREQRPVLSGLHKIHNRVTSLIGIPRMKMLTATNQIIYIYIKICPPPQLLYEWTLLRRCRQYLQAFYRMRL